MLLTIWIHSLEHYWLNILLLNLRLINHLLLGNEWNTISINKLLWLSYLRSIHLIWVDYNRNILLRYLLLVWGELNMWCWVLLYWLLLHLNLLSSLIHTISNHLELSSSISSAASNKRNSHDNETYNSHCNKQTTYWISKSFHAIMTFFILIHIAMT